jgi:predicted nucleotidyltransferase
MDAQFTSPKLKSICEQNGIVYLGLFGSYARGEEHPDSDIDLLVEYDRPVGYLTHAKVENILEDFFNKPVDLVFRKSVKTRIKPYITQDLKTVYEKR